MGIWGACTFFEAAIADIERGWRRGLHWRVLWCDKLLTHGKFLEFLREFSLRDVVVILVPVVLVWYRLSQSLTPSVACWVERKWTSQTILRRFKRKGKIYKRRVKAQKQKNRIWQRFLFYRTSLEGVRKSVCIYIHIYIIALLRPDVIKAKPTRATEA